VAALEVGAELGPEAVVVVLIPDSGKGYLSKIYNDGWMADYGFLRSDDRAAGDLLHGKRSDLPELVHIHPDETVRAAIDLLREYEVSQLPVVSAEPPIALGEVAGSVRERHLMARAYDDPSILDRPVSEVMDEPLPMVGIGEPIDDVVRRLEASGAVLVLDGGRPTGIITRSDVLELMADHDESTRDRINP
jgi:cystathionine beta-synthase